MKKQLILASLASLALNVNATNSTLIQYECAECDSLEKSTVSFDWLIKTTPIKQAKPLKRTSKSYQLKVSGEQLSQGVMLSTQGHQAIIRIDGADDSLNTDQLVIIAPDKKTLSLNEASIQISNNSNFTTNQYFSHSQRVFQLKSELGHGQFILKAKANNNLIKNQYIINVFDKYASTELSIQTDKINYFYGDDITVDINISGDEIIYPQGKITAVIISPDGQQYPLHLSKLSYSHYQGLSQISSKVNTAGENWYVRVDTESMAGNDIIYRHATSGLSYAIPSANLLKIEQQPNDNNDISYQASLDVSTQSRYMIEATLYGHDDNDQLKPMMVTQTAQFLSPGKHELDVIFHDSKIKQSTLHQPYELKNIRVVDYGQLRVVTK